MKFLWYMTNGKIQVEFEKGGYASILTGIIAPGNHKNCVCSVLLNNLNFND